MVVPPASRTSGVAASPKCSAPSVTPLASTVVMRPAPLRRSRSPRALRTEPRSVSSCRAFPRVHPLRATAEFVYGAHNHQARVRLACGFHNGGLVGAVGGTVYGGARSRNGAGSHGNSRLLSQRSRSILRERWLRCSDTVWGFRPGHVPLWVPHITARFPPLASLLLLPPRGRGPVWPRPDLRIFAARPPVARRWPVRRRCPGVSAPAEGPDTHARNGHPMKGQRPYGRFCALASEGRRPRPVDWGSAARVRPLGSVEPAPTIPEPETDTLKRPPYDGFRACVWPIFCRPFGIRGCEKACKKYPIWQMCHGFSPALMVPTEKTGLRPCMVEAQTPA